jgi:isopentenyl-diphosphate delta-isomerase
MVSPEMLILVNEHDQETGLMEKMQVHQQGLLHRAFSILIFNEKNQLLLQQRASHKYHSALLWTNTCCGHPRTNESTPEAANRRLKEEMGFSVPLKKLFSFKYESVLENNLIEHEFDHVFVGRSNEAPIPNEEEVSDWKFISMDQLMKEIQLHPSNYTTWFKLILKETEKINQYLNN